MELTITQNGALYALQHRGIDRYRGARSQLTNADKIIRSDELLPASSLIWYKLKLRV
jgi:hypothetical protein